MAFPGFNNEYKKIGAVWVLNLLPPCSGFGTIYALGTASLVIVIPIWIYVIANHLSYESFLNGYLVLSVIGTIGAFIHNINLSNDLYNRNNQERLDLGDRELDSFALDSFERKMLEAERMLKDKKAEVELISNIKSGAPIQLNKVQPEVFGDRPAQEIEASALNERAVLRNLFSEDSIADSLEEVAVQNRPEIDRPVLFESKSEVETSKTPAIEPLPGVRQESIPEANSEPVLEEDLEPALTPSLDAEPVLQAVRLPESEEAVERVLDKMAEATGEFQPKVKVLEPQVGFGEYKFSTDFDTFKFEPALTATTNFDNLAEGEKLSSKCIDCGSDVNANFAFCLSCGKIF